MGDGISDGFTKRFVVSILGESVGDPLGMSVGSSLGIVVGSGVGLDIEG
jgi:hypothetical protein